MKRLTFLIFMLCLLHITSKAQKFLSAKDYVKSITVGWNLGDALDCFAGDSIIDTETAWGNPRTTKSMIDSVRKAGFNTVRVPVCWFPHFLKTKDLQIDPKWISRVKEVVGYCLDNDMNVLINCQNDLWIEAHPLYKDSADVIAKERAFWTILANEFKDYDGRLAFSGTNEIHLMGSSAPATDENAEVQNRFNQVFVDVVRATGGNNLKRNLLVQTYYCNATYNLPKFVKPKDKVSNHLIMEIHCYNPETYTYLGKPEVWGKYNPYSGKPLNIDIETLKKQFPNVDPKQLEEGLKKKKAEGNITDEKYLERYFDNLAAASTKLDIPVIVSEFGCFRWYGKDAPDTDPKKLSRAWYYENVVRNCKRHGFAPCVWDNGYVDHGKEPFGLFDRHNNMKPESFIIKAIMKGLN